MKRRASELICAEAGSFIGHHAWMDVLAGCMLPMLEPRDLAALARSHKAMRVVARAWRWVDLVAEQPSSVPRCVFALGPTYPPGLPRGVTHLVFVDCFEPGPLLPGIIPSSVTHISFGELFFHRGPLLPGVFPSSLTHLTVDEACLLPGSLPSSLTHLVLDDTESLKSGVLPENLVYLEIGWEEAPTLLPRLPAGLKHLVFGYWSGRGQVLGPDTLPRGLTHLSMGRGFKQPLEGILPDTLTDLTLGRPYDTPLPSVLPAGLKNIKYQ